MSNESKTPTVTRIERDYTMDDNTYWAIVIVALCLSVLGLTAILSLDYTQRVTAAFAAGYEEGTVPGNNGTVWVKSK